MKKIAVGFGVLALFLVQLGVGFGGLFDDLLTPPKDKRQQQKTAGEEQKPKGLIEGLGGIFGAKERDIDLINTGLKTIQALQPIEEEEEIAIGEGVALEAFHRFGGEYNNDALVQYVNLVGKTVSDVSDRPELNYHFAILNSQEQNAFAAPGGYIFLTLGLLQALKNEAELAGVLAHEVAHVTQKHMLETIRRGAILANVSSVTLSAMNKDPNMFSNVINEVTDKLFDKGLDKDLEYEADVIGVEYAYRAGYNTAGLRNYLHTLQSQEGRARSRFFTTHPSTATRIAKINDLLRKYQDGTAFPTLAERFMRAMKSA